MSVGREMNETDGEGWNLESGGKHQTVLGDLAAVLLKKRNR